MNQAAAAAIMNAGPRCILCPDAGKSLH
jgi:hypothetical protein